MDNWLTNNVWMSTTKISTKDDVLPKAWMDFLDLSLFFKKKLQSVLDTCQTRRNVSIVYPETSDIMKWSKLTHPTNISVVILGQDPYHGGQATGLAFEVGPSAPIPPSLKNIFAELKRSYCDFNIPQVGCLESWSEQGVLLLNSILTVEKGKPGSHAKLGWAWFTDYIISSISDKNDNCVFMLWGNKAIEKEILINNNRHLVLKAQHPSPLSALSSGCKQDPFYGCNHFVLANQYLTQHNKRAIDWRL